MLLTIDVSKLNEETLCDVVRQINEPQQLACLAKHDSLKVLKEVIKNNHTTKETRGEIYLNNTHSTEILSLLVKYSLNSQTIHSMIENMGKEDIHLYALACQQDISSEDLKTIFNRVINDDNIFEKYRNEILEYIVKNPNADQEVLQALIDYSCDMACLVVRANRECIRIDLTRRLKKTTQKAE